jgi:glycosyltransferase involved in cell wall biosynthesis
MKLIIQIPCLNERDHLPVALRDLPKSLPGIDAIEVLIIDDGSTDGTSDVAREHGVRHIVRFPQNRGLAKAYMAGLARALQEGADIIVNTDADNQYCGADIGKLVEPILRREAEIVVGARPIAEIEHFSPFKKLLQKIGSWVVRVASRTDIPDAPSGFRALSRNAAFQLNVFNEHTYTLETIIQAGRKGMAITSVPIRTNGKLRESRLIRSIPQYVWRSSTVILRIFMIYKPLRFFWTLGTVPFAAGVVIGLRWLWLTYYLDVSRTHIPSLILASILLLMGFQLFILGLLAELSAANRLLLEDIQQHLRRAAAGRPS